MVEMMVRVDIEGALKINAQHSHQGMEHYLPSNLTGHFVCGEPYNILYSSQVVISGLFYAVITIKNNS